jgi:hypothetical protein
MINLVPNNLTNIKMLEGLITLSNDAKRADAAKRCVAITSGSTTSAVPTITSTPCHNTSHLITTKHIFDVLKTHFFSFHFLSSLMFD